ncbi:MAG: O-antigen ligase domain-containing protein [Candidatus Omnitrophica bacterium]|nr:O-antigen ligase domain-containing protein [Candidatus Omnitrophota bacterium]
MAQLFGMILVVLAMLGLGIYIGPTVIENPQIIIGTAVGGFVLLLALTRFNLALMFLLFIIPFSVQFNLGYLTGKTPIDFSVDDFFIICVAFTWLVYLTKSRKPPYVANSMTWPFVAYFSASLISFIPMVASGKGNIALSMLHLIKWYEYVFVYFVLVRTLESREQIVKFAVLQIISSVMITLFQFFQILTGFARGQTSGFAHSAMATFGSNGILGAYYVFFLSIIISFIVTAKSPKYRLWLFASAGLMAFTLFYTFARSAYLGMVVAFIVLGFLHRKMMAIFSLLLLCMLPAVSSKAVNQRISMTTNLNARALQRVGHFNGNRNAFYKMAQSSGGITLDESSMERLKAWRRAKQVIYDNLFIGTGYWSGRFVGIFGMTTAHSFYVTTILELGIVGLGSFIWLSWALIFNAAIFGDKTRDSFYCAISRGLVAGYVGILVHCVFGETFEDFRLTGPLWMMCGIVFAAKRIDEEARGIYR